MNTSADCHLAKSALRRVTLAELTLKITKGTTPTTVGGRFVDHGINFLKVESISEDGALEREKLAQIDEHSDGLLSRSRLEEHDVLFSIAGAIGRTYLVRLDDLPANVNQALAIVRFDPGKMHPKYGYYAMRDRGFQSDALGRVVQTAQANVNLTQLANSAVTTPSLVIQERIADILSSYDDLIANNRRRMALLEDAARRLYDEWFVRLRFPGHEHTRITNGVPERWERVRLGDRVTLNYGKALKSEERSPGDFPVYGSSGIVGTHEKWLAASPGIVVGRKGNVGSVYWCRKAYWPIDTVYFIDAATSNLWLYYALQHMHFISTDVAVPGLNRDFAYSRGLIVPEPRIVREFLSTANPLHEHIDRLGDINERLRSARDLLLPRLMSGEIAV